MRILDDSIAQAVTATTRSVQRIGSAPQLIDGYAERTLPPDCFVVDRGLVAAVFGLWGHRCLLGETMARWRQKGGLKFAAFRCWFNLAAALKEKHLAAR
jgi:hypothetical protein